MPTFTQKTWVDVPDESNPPTGAVMDSAAERNRQEQGIADAIAHANALYSVHGGLVYYTGASNLPPASPPAQLIWVRSDTGDVVRNTGTPGAPVWSPVFVDNSKLTAADFVSDYVVSGLLAPVPSPESLTLTLSAGAAYAGGRRHSKAATPRSVPARKSTLVDLSSLGEFSNVDNGVLLDDCEDLWNEKTDADFVQSIIAGPVGSGNAIRFTIGLSAVAGDFVTEAIPLVDLTPYGKLRLRVRSSIALAAGDLQVLLDDTPLAPSPVHTLNLPALAANTWTTVETAYTPAAGSAAIISVGLKYALDKGVMDFDVADVWAYKDPEPSVPAGSIRLFEAKADADIAQVERVTVTTAVNSTIYTVRINGVDVTYTSDASATVAEISAGLVAAINASVDPMVIPVAAVDETGLLRVTADTPGVAFTISVGANLTVAQVTPNSVASVTEVMDRRDLTPTMLVVPQAVVAWDEITAKPASFVPDAHNFWSASHPDIDASDVPANGDVTTFDSTSGKWKASPPPAGGASALDDLSDVTITNPQTGEVLKRAANGTWTNQTDATGGGSGTLAAPIPVLVVESVSVSNMPSALQELGSGAIYRPVSDLTNATQARISVNTTIAGAAGSEIRAQYSTDSGSTWSYLDGTSGPAATLAGAIGPRAGAWVNLAPAAKANVWLRFVTINGDGVADPSLRTLQLQVK